MSIVDINEFILSLEKDLDLFNLEIEGIYFWKLLRAGLRNRISIKIGALGVGHTGNSQRAIDKLKVLPGLFINSYIHGFCSRRSRVDTLVIQHPRKLNIGNEFIDIYTEPVIKTLRQGGDKFEIVDHPMLRKHFNRPSRERSYLEHEYIGSYIYSRFNRIKLDSSTRDLLRDIENRITEKFSIKIGLISRTQNLVNKFKREEAIYLKALKRRRVKKLYLVVSYGKEAIISACNRLNIRVIEVQHGVMSPYHLGYHFPGSTKIPYFPNEFQAFGEFWRDSVAIPLATESIPVTGYSYLNSQLEEFSSLKKIDNRVLFISQGVIGDRLSKIALDYALENSSMEVIYKLHPGEYDRWREEYSHLNDLPVNLKVIDNNETGLYQLFGEAKYVVGVFSTALYEALAMGCITVVCNLPGYEYLTPLIEDKLVGFLDTETENLKDIIVNLDTREVEKGYFFY